MKKIILYLIASNLFMSQLTWAACSQGTTVQADGSCQYSADTLNAMKNINECNAKASGSHSSCQLLTFQASCTEIASCHRKLENLTNPIPLYPGAMG